MGNKIICTILMCLVLQVGRSQHIERRQGFTGCMTVYEPNLSRYIFDTASARKRIFILKNNKSCIRCFEQVASYIRSIVSPADSIECFILSLCDSSIYSIRMFISENKVTTPGFGRNLFLFPGKNNRPPEGSVFEQVEISPALLFQNRDTITLIRNQDMYLGADFYTTKIDEKFRQIFR